MMSNNNNFVNTSSPLAKQEELQQFERNFFPAGGAPLDNNLSSNIPSAPAAPQLSNVKSKPINLKTRNWGPKLENGYAGVNRSLYDRPNVFYWDSKPSLGERQLQQQLPLASPSSSSSSTSTTSSGWSNNIPQAPMLPQWRALQNNGLFGGRRLRTRDWGRMSRKRAQWTKFNRELYANGLQLERNVILNELWAKYQPRGLNNGEGLSRGISDNNLVAAPVSSSYIESLTNVTTVPLTNITTAPLTTVTSAPVTNVISAPVEVRATSVPVPMLNPPLNDGRRYEKLYAMNTKSNGGKSLIKPRGTRRDHLVQPASNMFPVATPLTSGILPLGQQQAAAPTKKQLRQQKKLAKRNQKNGVAAPINSGLTSVPVQTMLPIYSSVAPIQQPVYTTVSPIQPVLSTLPVQQPLTTGLVNPALGTGLVEPAPAMGKVKHAKLGSAPLKRPRRARKAGKGAEQPVFSNMVSATQGTPILSTQQTTPILPLTQQTTMGPTFVKQETLTPVQPLAFGTPVM